MDAGAGAGGFSRFGVAGSLSSGERIEVVTESIARIESDRLTYPKETISSRLSFPYQYGIRS